MGSKFKVQARPGATECGYDIVIAYYGLDFPSPHLGMSGLGQGFIGYNGGILLSIVIKIRNKRLNPLGKTVPFNINCMWISQP